MSPRIRFPATFAASAAIAWALISILPPAPTMPGRGALIAHFGGPSEAFARLLRISDTSFIGFSRFSPVLGLRHRARLIEATGPFACDPGEFWRVDVVITQDAADPLGHGHGRGGSHGLPFDQAIAEGHAQGTCSGEPSTWHVRAIANGPYAFAPGPAEGCGTISTRFRGTTTDSFEWCGEFLLESAD